jgi:HSP20 family protein
MSGKTRIQDFEAGRRRLEAIEQRLKTLRGQVGTPPPGTSGAGAAQPLAGLATVIDWLEALTQQVPPAATGPGPVPVDGQAAGGAGALRAVYGVSVRWGLQGLQVQRFGNLRTGRAQEPQVVVQDVREPLVDVFDEESLLQVVAEVPGVTLEDVQLELRGDVLMINAGGSLARYRKEVQLPQRCVPENMRVACRNGILAVVLAKAEDAG